MSLYVGKGCACSNLLACRATQFDPLALVAVARSAAAFTIGAAAIEGSYAHGAGGLAAQLAAIVRDCERAG